MALSIEAALARRSSDVRTAGEGAAADDHAAGLWMERSTCGPVAMVRPCWLSLLPDDLLLPILSFVDEVDAALMGATCRALHALASHPSLWRTFCTSRWPLLTASHPTAQDWRALHRSRVLGGTPQWRELCVRFDKTVSVIRADDDGEWAEELAPTLLSIAIILARLPRARRSGAELDLWASHLGRELLCPARLDQLREWVLAAVGRLDAWWDYAMMEDVGANGGDTARQLHVLLRQGLVARSALELIRDEVVSRCDAEQLWGAAAQLIGGLAHQIESAFSSLELEGFNVCLPPGMVPRGAPQEHWWWHCTDRPRHHYSAHEHDDERWELGG